MGLNIADLKVTTDDFEPGGRIPDRISADGGNTEPRLTVTGVPADAVELALIAHDPDAPLPHGFTHGTTYGLPATDGPIDTASARRGPNGMGEAAWTGPQPPHGHGDHRYYFWVYALSKPVEGTPSREEFLEQYADAIVEQNRVVGVFSR
ncbi:YbhB/YbcL family Raf kinase inhibitor-like protein [Agrococcus beijingensis]|uniref:YbhB/YbcL family Raf kinase inhibitor-like protein n=1 Tax=Agrococcus beijingensis TaxID=3068634 RepID=UPI002742764B|nr:YbhB/YbcL family Raf kinase inhibitor-like protein [Agrococcus sp. REN33]